MKTLFTLIGLALASTPALADGFICASEQDNLVVKIFNHTDPEIGTRNGAVMILSDSSLTYGNKTIATFNDAKSTLGNEGSVYTANVDHRVRESSREGELLAGTNIGNLKFVVVDLDFSYNRPLADGAFVRGDMTLIKRDGDKILIDLSCTRYLKD